MSAPSATTTHWPAQVQPAQGRPVLRSRQASLRKALLAGTIAACVAGGLTLLLRAALEVRSAPERLQEAILLVLPLDWFAAGLQLFGFDAKRYSLYITSAALVVLLAFLGALAVRLRWAPLGVGLGLWLLAMLGLLPLTGAGAFASGLFDGRWSAILGYLAVALAYAGLLAWIDVEPVAARSMRITLEGRRASISLFGGAAVAVATGLLVDRSKPARPLTDIETPQAAQTSTAVELAAEADVGLDLPVPPASSPAPTVPAIPRFPEPPPPRRIKRDKDGAVLPAGRRPGELTDLITNNDDFYVVSKNAAGDPVQAADTWRLRIDTTAGARVELDYLNLRQLPALEITKTLECISNFAAQCELAPFGCDLISTARWTGARLTDVITQAGGVPRGATTLIVSSADEYTTSLPLEIALDPETLLAYEMNGQTLPREHGYPVRLLVPGRYGMKNPKWVVGLRFAHEEVADWYGQRNWTKEAVVRTMTRIDVPAPAAALVPGEYNVAGIAYAGDRGIQQVEFSIDGGQTWQVADLLEPQAGRDAWVRWLGTFVVLADDPVTVIARATDGTGTLQPDTFSLPQPDGSTGWPSVQVHPRAA